MASWCNFNEAQWNGFTDVQWDSFQECLLAFYTYVVAAQTLYDPTEATDAFSPIIALATLHEFATYAVAVPVDATATYEGIEAAQVERDTL